MGFGESDAGVGEVSLAGFNGADHGLTAGSSSGKTQLEFCLAPRGRSQEQMFVASHI
jgi:hypothetical protein